MRSKVQDYFKEIEFERCVPSCKKSDMDDKFLLKLNSCRELCNTPFILNSAFRSSEWDKSKGRTGIGFHTKGRAVDIRCIDPEIRSRIVINAMSCGLNGIGISKTFIHLDDRAIPSLWLYD